MKNNLPYFTHDNDAGAHWKLKALKTRFGWEGCGRFWRLAEMIARAEDCRLNISKPQIRADCASELSLSVDALNEFIVFLADSEECDLVLFEDGFLTTDRAQEDLGRAMKTRRADRERAKRQTRAETGQFRQEKDRIQPGPAAEQSRVEETRAEQSSPPGLRPENGRIRPEVAAAACPPFSPAQIQDRLAFAQLDISLDEAGANQVAQALRAAGCEDLSYLDWALERIHARDNGKPINNPAGYLLSVVALPDWIAAWRQERELRAAVRRPPAPAPPPEPAEPDNPAAVEQLLKELPWKPGGKRKIE